MLNWRRLIWQGGTVIEGDINAHSIQWDPRSQAQRNAVLWEHVIDENGLEIGNDSGVTHHWTREGQNGMSVIDLIMAIWQITTWSMLADNHITGSDYDVLECELEVDRQEEADNERVVGCNLTALPDEDVVGPVEMLWMEVAKERNNLDTQCTADYISKNRHRFEKMDPMHRVLSTLYTNYLSR